MRYNLESSIFGVGQMLVYILASALLCDLFISFLRLIFLIWKILIKIVPIPHYMFCENNTSKACSTVMGT